MNKPQKKWMKLAIDSATAGMTRQAGGPFGACIVRKGKAVAVSHSTVLKSCDATCHAEINAIREASKKLKRYDLSDCTVYSTTEPCPMCFSAIHWARIPAVYFGTGIPFSCHRPFNIFTKPYYYPKALRYRGTCRGNETLSFFSALAGKHSHSYTSVYLSS